MANVIRIKRRASGGTGAPSSLENAELAYNEVDDTLWYGKGNSGGFAVTIEAVGGRGAVVMLSGSQTITGAKTFSSDLSAVTQANGDNSGLVATTAFVKNQGYVTGNQSITVSGDASGSGTTAITLALASVNSDVGTYPKVTVNAKGLVTAATTLSASDVPTITSAKVSDFDTQVRTSRLDQMAAPTASVDMNSQRITGLETPTQATDAANKSYVDSTAAGLHVHAPVRAASTGNLTLSGTQTVDGVSLVASDRVLVKDQSTASQNGVYVVAAGAWSRATDMDVTGEAYGGAFMFVQEGTTNADSGWVCSTDGAITIDSTSIAFSQFNGAGGAVTAGNGLTKTGNTLDVVGTTDRISVAADAIDIDIAYAGQTSIVTLGTVTTGTWSGTTVALNKGGTGATDAAGARTALGATTVGANLFTLANPGAITFPKIAADNTVSTESASTHRTSLGATTVGSNFFTATDPSAITFPKVDATNAVTFESASTHRTSIGATTVGSNFFTATNPSAITFPKVDAANAVTFESASTYRASLGATTLGANLFTAANPSAITFLKINADNSVTTETAANYRTSLGATTVGANLFMLGNPSAVRFIRINADNTVTAEDAAAHMSSIGTLTVGMGGTGVTTITGLVKGNGTSAMTAAVAGTDYLSPSSSVDGGTF